MIDRERKIIFVHFPKAGGSTVEAMLVGADDVGFHDKPDSEILTKDPFREFFPLGRHATLGEYEAMLEGEGEDIRDYRVFTTVRDPHRQLVSLFNFRRQKFFGREGPFSGIRNWIHKVLYSSFTFFLCDTLARYFLTVVLPLKPVYRRCMRLNLFRIYLRTKSGVKAKVFRLEDISKDPSPMYAYLDLPSAPPLKRMNRTKASAGVSADNKLLRFVAGIVYKNQIRDFYSDELPSPPQR